MTKLLVEHKTGVCCQLGKASELKLFIVLLMEHAVAWGKRDPQKGERTCRPTNAFLKLKEDWQHMLIKRRSDGKVDSLMSGAQRVRVRK